MLIEPHRNEEGLETPIGLWTSSIASLEPCLDARPAIAVPRFDEQHRVEHQLVRDWILKRVRDVDQLHRTSLCLPGGGGLLRGEHAANVLRMFVRQQLSSLCDHSDASEPAILRVNSSIPSHPCGPSARRMLENDDKP